MIISSVFEGHCSSELTVFRDPEASGLSFLLQQQSKRLPLCRVGHILTLLLTCQLLVVITCCTDMQTNNTRAEQGLGKVREKEDFDRSVGYR